MITTTETDEYQVLRDALNGAKSVRVTGHRERYLKAARKMLAEGVATMEIVGRDLVVTRRELEFRGRDKEANSAAVLEALGAVRLR